MNLERTIENMYIAEIAKLLNVSEKSAQKLKAGLVVDVPLDAKKLNVILDKF